MRNKRKILIVGLVVVLLGITIALATHRQAGVDNSSADPRQGLVVLENAYYYGSSLDTSDIKSVQQELYRQVKKYGGMKSYYAGTIRQGSFATTYGQYDGTTPPIQVPMSTYIVDISGVEQSYVVSLSGGPNYPYDILHVTCPTTDQLKYSSFGCVNEEQ